MKRTAVVIALGVLALGAAVALVQVRCGTPEEASTAPAAPRRTSTRAPLPGPAIPTAPPSGSLSVRGRVVDAEGRPAAGAEVSATRPQPGESVSELPCSGDEPEVPLSSSNCPVEDVLMELVQEGRGGAPVLAHTTTAQDGTFTLDGLPEGSVAVWALSPRGSAMEPEVQAGAADVELVLEEGLSLAGRVMAESGAPLPGAQVTVLHEENARYFETRTGEDGRFTLGPLPEGSYTLVASSPGLLPTLVSQVSPEEAQELILYGPRRLTGLVLFQGTPAPGVQVRLEDSSHAAVTDAQGRFSFEPLGPDDYVVQAERDGLYAVAEVSLSEEEREADVTLRLGTALYVEGMVRDEAGQPVTDAWISVMSADEGPSDAASTSTEEGRFRLGPVAPGLYTFSLDADGYEDLEVENVTIPSGQPLHFVLPRSITLEGLVTDADGKPLEDVELEAVRQPPPESEQQEAAARQTGKAPADMTLEERLAAIEERSRGADTWSATTGEDGRFLFEVSSRGRYTVRVSGGDYLFARLETDAPSRGLRFTLRAGAQLEGTVVDARGAPLPQVNIKVEQGTGEHHHELETMTGQDGRFSLGGVLPGTHVVRAEYNHGGFEHRASRTVQVQGTETVDASLRMDTGQSVSGIVVDEQGRPLEDADVRAFVNDVEKRTSLNFNRLAHDTTGPDGRFTVHHLAQGECTLIASKSGYDFVAPARAEGLVHMRPSGVLVQAGARDVRLVMRYLGRIRGRVIRPDGTPLPRFELNEESIRDAEGRFSVNVDQQDTLRLVFEAPGLTKAVREVQVRPGQDMDLGDVRLEAGRQVRGRVVDAQTSAPVAGARVRAILPGEDPWEATHNPLAEARSGIDGTFALPLLEARPLRLEVHHPGHVPHRQRLGLGDETLEVRLYTGARVEGTVRDRNGRPVPSTVRLVPTDRQVHELEDEDEKLSASAFTGSFSLDRVEPGDYTVSVEQPHLRHDTPRFLPQRVRLPPSGRVVLAFTEMAGTSTLRVTVERNVPERHWSLDVSLVPGSVSPSAGLEELRALARNLAVEPHRGYGLGEQLFEGLPGGRYTLLLLLQVEYEKYQVYQEEFDVPEGTETVREVYPVWQPAPPPSY